VRTPLFRGTKRWGLLGTCLLLSSILLSACGENSPSILNTYGPVAHSESYVFWVILVIASIVFVGVEGMLLYSIFKFRERPGMPHPRQNHGNLKIEIIWTIVPMIVLFVVLFFTVQGLLQVAPENQPTDKPVINVEAYGHQWWWEFYYPDYKITTADSLHIPAGSTIHVDLYSNNVIHSFWVPALTGKTDLIPGHHNQKWFQADQNAVGKTFLGICAEYCGTQHGNMRFEVVVDDNNQFQTWISTQQQAAATPAGGLAAQGATLFASQCTSCHGIVGVDLKPNQGQQNQYGYNDPEKTCDLPNSSCLIGPNLTHFGSRHLIAGGVLAYDANSPACNPDNPNLLKECGLAQWLNDPQGVKPGNDMAINQLTPDQIKELVAYLESLK